MKLRRQINRAGSIVADRRDILLLAGAAAISALAGATETKAQGLSRLQTRMFNFKDDVSPDEAMEIVAGLKDAAASSGAKGFMAGRNFIPDPFPARFEWLFMFQSAAEGGDAREKAFNSAVKALAARCRNQVTCISSARSRRHMRMPATLGFVTR